MTSDDDVRRPDIRSDLDAGRHLGPDSGPDATTGATPDARSDHPERRPLNLSGWIGLAAGAGAFLASLLVGWTGAVVLAALALALSITGLVRVYRGRATNGAAAAGGLTLAVATIVLGFVWAHLAQPCIPLTNDTQRFNQCYQDNTGLL
jgi:hypothetical protein